MRQLFSSWPDLFRPSTSWLFAKEDVDARDEHGHDARRVSGSEFLLPHADDADDRSLYVRAGVVGNDAVGFQEIAHGIGADQRRLRGRCRGRWPRDHDWLE